MTVIITTPIITSIIITATVTPAIVPSETLWPMGYTNNTNKHVILPLTSCCDLQAVCSGIKLVAVCCLKSLNRLIDLSLVP